jgi:hypothetical protein
MKVPPMATLAAILEQVLAAGRLALMKAAAAAWAARRA